MKKTMSRILGSASNGESGFTLIEMLIVVGIIVALAAAIVPQVVQFGERGTEGAAASEQAAVQAAMDSMLADEGISSVTANTQSINAWNAVNADLTGAAVAPTYLSVTSTTYSYCWNTLGRITKQLDTTPAALDCS